MAYLEEWRKESSVAKLNRVDHKANKEHVLHALCHIDAVDAIADRVLCKCLQSKQDGKNGHNKELTNEENHVPLHYILLLCLLALIGTSPWFLFTFRVDGTEVKFVILPWLFQLLWIQRQVHANFLHAVLKAELFSSRLFVPNSPRLLQ